MVFWPIIAPYRRSAQIIGPEFADETGHHGTIRLAQNGWNVEAIEIMQILLLMEFGWRV